METYLKLLENNRKWAKEKQTHQPEFFNELAKSQTPEFMWIGCSDSRVPANQIIGLLPGEIFVHRNVANIVSHGDLNCLSSLQYAVDVLHVRHVIVCGHYGCGGICAVDQNLRVGIVDNWLRYIHDIKREYAEELSKLDDEARVNRLCELNVLTQVRNVCESTILRDAWANGKEVAVHGWIYSLDDGILRELSEVQHKPQSVVALKI
ncbi:carbonate dehydratase [Kiritimatiellota bacterium B12222]|nr:carbonate dehydratase [Kiritimatiellota bacterium B12222]